MEKLRKTLITAGGIILLMFGAFHILFWNFFFRSAEFAIMNKLFSKIIQMLNIGIITFFISLGILILSCRNEIINTKSGRGILLVSALFFFIRGAAEFAFPERPVALIVCMLLCSILFFVPALTNWKRGL